MSESTEIAAGCGPRHLELVLDVSPARPAPSTPALPRACCVAIGIAYSRVEQYSGLRQYCFAVLYGEWGRAQLGDDFELTDGNIEPFVYETVRRFPPVAGVPSWDRRTNTHTVIDLHTASLDDAAWGDGDADGAMAFKLRPLHEYHAKHVGWANQALERAKNGAPFSRACPAKDMSVSIMCAFLRAFVKSGGMRRWRLGGGQTPRDIKITAYSATAVQLTDTRAAP